MSSSSSSSELTGASRAEQTQTHHISSSELTAHILHGGSAKTIDQVRALAQGTKDASVVLRSISTDCKNQLLYAVADALVAEKEAILLANSVDVNNASGISDSLKDRLTLTEGRILGLAQGVRKIAELPDPIGEVVRGYTLPNGISLRQVRVPLGVVGVVYEARPNVTSDSFAIGIKSGNSVLLRGSSSAARTNEKLVDIFQTVLKEHGLPVESVNLLPSSSHDSVVALIKARGLVDIVIPRGGENLINNVVNNATVPTIETGVGNCHIYVHKEADLLKAGEIILNAKTRRPSVCNTVETVLIDEDIRDWLPDIVQLLTAAGVTVHGDEPGMVPATEDDWSQEYLSLDLAVKIVADDTAAIEHISRYGTGHTECIITENIGTANNFLQKVDAAAVMVNASTAFTDGEQFGFGAEIGISTQKLHARGPMGLAELTSTKWIVWGDGHTRA